MKYSDAKNMAKYTGFPAIAEYLFSSIFKYNNLCGFCTVSSQVLIKTKERGIFLENHYEHDKRIGIMRSLISS